MIPAALKAAPLAFKALPWKLIGLCALGLFIASLIAALMIERRQSDKLKAQVEACAEARKADRETYARGQAEAALKNKEQVHRIKSAQEKINAEVSSDLHSRLERLRRELQQKAAAAGGAAKGPGASANGKPTGGTDEAAMVCFAPGELLRAAENEERHDQLISWLEKQLAVPR